MTMTETGTSRIGEATIAEFAAGLRGTAVQPGDDDYERDRNIWNGAHDRHPAVIAKCAGVADVLRTIEFARRIAKLPSMTALLIKESVNQTMDNMGFHNALNACFTLHQLNHAHWAEVREDHYPVADEAAGVPNWRATPSRVVTDSPGRARRTTIPSPGSRSRS